MTEQSIPPQFQKQATKKFPSIREFWNAMRHNPSDVDGLALESCIRDVIKDINTPFVHDISMSQKDMTDVRQDHNLLCKRLAEYEGRLHKLQEFVRHATDKNQLLTKQDMEWINQQLDDKLMMIDGSIEMFQAKCNEQDAKIGVLQNILINEKPFQKAVDKEIHVMKTFIKDELKAIHKKLQEDYELHWTKYMDVHGGFKALKRTEMERHQTMKEIQAKMEKSMIQFDQIQVDFKDQTDAFHKLQQRSATEQENLARQFSDWQEQLNETIDTKFTCRMDALETDNVTFKKEQTEKMDYVLTELEALKVAPKELIERCEQTEHSGIIEKPKHWVPIAFDEAFTDQDLSKQKTIADASKQFSSKYMAQVAREEAEKDIPPPKKLPLDETLSRFSLVIHREPHIQQKSVVNRMKRQLSEGLAALKSGVKKEQPLTFNSFTGQISQGKTPVDYQEVIKGNVIGKLLEERVQILVNETMNASLTDKVGNSLKKQIKDQLAEMNIDVKTQNGTKFPKNDTNKDSSKNVGKKKKNSLKVDDSESCSSSDDEIYERDTKEEPVLKEGIWMKQVTTHVKKIKKDKTGKLSGEDATQGIKDFGLTSENNAMGQMKNDQSAIASDQKSKSKVSGFLSVVNAANVESKRLTSENSPRNEEGKIDKNPSSFKTNTELNINSQASQRSLTPDQKDKQLSDYLENMNVPSQISAPKDKKDYWGAKGLRKQTLAEVEGRKRSRSNLRGSSQGSQSSQSSRKTDRSERKAKQKEEMLEELSAKVCEIVEKKVITNVNQVVKDSNDSVDSMNTMLRKMIVNQARGDAYIRKQKGQELEDFTFYADQLSKLYIMIRNGLLLDNGLMVARNRVDQLKQQRMDVMQKGFTDLLAKINGSDLPDVKRRQIVDLLQSDESMNQGAGQNPTNDWTSGQLQVPTSPQANRFGMNQPIPEKHTIDVGPAQNNRSRKAMESHVKQRLKTASQIVNHYEQQTKDNTTSSHDQIPERISKSQLGGTLSPIQNPQSSFGKPPNYMNQVKQMFGGSMNQGPQSNQTRNFDRTSAGPGTQMTDFSSIVGSPQSLPKQGQQSSFGFQKQITVGRIR